MHQGHRNRLTGKIKEGGIVYGHELLEILLFNACPRKDLNAAAHSLVKRFNTFEGVFEADCIELEKVDGVGENMAEYIAVLGKALRALRPADGFAVVSNVCEFKKFILSRPVREVDCLELFCLDKDGRVRRIISFKANAGMRAAPAETEILKLVSAHRPYGLFAASKRACGSLRPDSLDDALCERIDKISRLCGANLYDYCLTDGNGGFYSFKMADRCIFALKVSGGGYGE